MSSIGLIVLAAGASARLGRPKQLLPIAGCSLLRHAARTALSSICRPVVVVLGAQARLLEKELHDLPVAAIRNPLWETGIGSSICAGLRTLPASELLAVIFMVCDQPMVSPELLNRLAAVHQNAAKGIVASEYSGTMGVPALFGRKYFAELAALPPGGGAKSLMVKHQDDLQAVPFPEGALDVDTTEDALRLQNDQGLPNRCSITI